MTEGPEAQAVADRMREAMQGLRLAKVELYQRDGTPAFTGGLEGRRVEAVSCHGKNILVHLDNGQSFRIHLLMHGRVRIGPPDAPLEGRLRLAFHLDGSRVAVVGAPKIELLSRAELDERRRAWGPDATQEGFDAEAFLRNLTGQGEASVAEALLEQSVVAGIGNMWKCEILHAARIDPRTPCAELTAHERRRLGELVPRMMRAAYEARREKQRIPARVYHRAGHPCRVCGAKIVYYRLAERGTYSCPVCQRREA